MASHANENVLENEDGFKLFVRSWIPDSPPRATIVICHGFNAHSGYYGWAAERCVADGLGVYALDLRGRGKSDGERFFVETIDKYAEDIGQAVELARGHHPDLPVFVLGHSAGGVAAAIYVLGNQEKLAGFICESFAYQVPAPDFALAAIKGLSHLAPHAHVLRLKNDDFSRDPDVVARMNSDALIANEVQPTRTVAAMVRADEWLKREFRKITLPLLILHGTADKVTRPRGSQAFEEAAGSTDKTLNLYEGNYHDLLGDIERERIMGDILGWIGERLPSCRRASWHKPIVHASFAE